MSRTEAFVQHLNFRYRARHGEYFENSTLKPHLRRQAMRFGGKPKAVIADAGYGGEKNYAYLENRRSTAVIRYSMYRKEQDWKWKKDIFKTDNWEYNKKEKPIPAIR